MAQSLISQGSQWLSPLAPGAAELGCIFLLEIIVLLRQGQQMRVVARVIGHHRGALCAVNSTADQLIAVVYHRFLRHSLSFDIIVQLNDLFLCQIVYIPAGIFIVIHFIIYVWRHAP